MNAGVDVPAPGLGDLQASQQDAALDSEEIGDRAGAPEADQRRVNPVLELGAVLDQVEAKAGELALAANPGIGEPDRRHQVALGEHRQDPGVDPVGLHRQRRQALDLLGVGDLHRPAVGLEGVVDEAGAGHRLDHRADGLAVPPYAISERFEAAGVGDRRKFVDQLSLLGEQADVEALSG